MNISAKKAHFMLMKWLPGITLCPRILPESTQGNHFWTKSSTARETYSYFQDFRKTANLVQKPNHPNKLFLNLSRAVGGGLFLQLKAYEMFRHLRQVTMAITFVQKFSGTWIVWRCPAHVAFAVGGRKVPLRTFPALEPHIGDWASLLQSYSEQYRYHHHYIFVIIIYLNVMLLLVYSQLDLYYCHCWTAFLCSRRYQ